MHLQNRQRGLTLMELLITLAIIGILAATAVPQYQNFVAKAQIRRAIAELYSMKSPVEWVLSEAADAQGYDATALGFNGSNLSTTLPSVSATAQGEVRLTMTMDGNVASAINGLDTELYRNAAGNWSCVIRLNGTLNGAYIPSECTVLAS